jgi:hypothetical protein
MKKTDAFFWIVMFTLLMILSVHAQIDAQTSIPWANESILIKMHHINTVRCENEFNTHTPDFQIQDSPPFEQILNRIFLCMGMKVRSSASDDCKYILDVESCSIAEYPKECINSNKFIVGNTRGTFKGKIQFAEKNGISLSDTFYTSLTKNVLTCPPGYVQKIFSLDVASHGKKFYDNSPFKAMTDGAYQKGGFIDVLFHILSRSFGFAPVLCGVEDENEGLRQNTAAAGDSAPPPLINGIIESIDSTLVKDIPVEDLIQLVHSEKSNVRKAAIKALAVGKDKKALPVLIGISQGGEYQKFIADLLGYFKDTLAVHYLLAQSLEEKDGISAAALNSLGIIHDSSVVSPLIEKFKNCSNYKFKEYIVTALGNIADTSASSLLLEALINRKTINKEAKRIKQEDESKQMFVKIAEALGKMKARRAIPFLIDFMNDDYEVMFYSSGGIYDTGYSSKESAYDALKSITGEDFGDNARQWRKRYPSK